MEESTYLYIPESIPMTSILHSVGVQYIFLNKFINM